jgi:glycosyltransferase involved in cell wall biosynthesis
MRILFVVNYYPPQQWGKAALRCQSMVDYLKDNGHQVYLLTGNYGVEKQETLQIQANKPIRMLKYVTYEKAGSYERWKLDKYNYVITLQIATEVRPDLTFIWDMADISIAPVLAIQKLKIPKIFEISQLWIDNYVHQDLFSRLKLRLKRLLPNTVGGKIDFNPSIVNSREIEKKLQQRYGLHKFYYLPVAVDVPSQVKSPDFSPTLKLMSSCEISEDKDFRTIFVALQKLQKQGVSFEYNLYGKIEPQYIYKLKKELERFGLASQVRFHTDQQAEKTCYEKNDIYLIPSGSQEIDLEILQAWAHKRLLIMAEISSGVQLNPGVDLLIFQDNLVELLKMVALDISQAQKMADAGYKHVCQDYNLKKIMQKTEEILIKEMMEQKEK